MAAGGLRALGGALVIIGLGLIVGGSIVAGLWASSHAECTSGSVLAAAATAGEQVGGRCAVDNVAWIAGVAGLATGLLVLAAGLAAVIGYGLRARDQ